ncbi:alpha/beta hydrolase [Aspergillus stella-maris]|uniref:alpha/beta hydrolase n=1 Tax=Aspergillus stella-maris TaxID=1810926 RepID=UPI003CCCA7B6
MPLSYDPEYAKALEPLLPLLVSQPRLKLHDIEGRRKRLDGFAAASSGSIPDAPGITISRRTFPSYDGAEIGIFLVHPTEQLSLPSPSPAYIHCYGGGMIAGSAEMYIEATALTVLATQIPFFSVDYRRAPENPHPTPTEDVYAALKWVSENAQRFNIEPARIGITGESAGGGIAAGVAIMARDRGLSPPLAKQVLIYPMLDDRNTSLIEDVEDLAFWKADDNLTGWTALLGDAVGTDGVSEYAAPARVKCVDGLPPLYIDVGELDIFREEAIDYMMKFVKAKISAEFHLYPGLPHGFEAIGKDIAATKRAMENRTRAWKAI